MSPIGPEADLPITAAQKKAPEAALAQAEVSGGVVRLGVLTDETGVLSSASGEGSIEAARMARRRVMPTQMQAGVYSAVTHYLKAVDALGSDEAKAVVAKMRDMPIHDFFADRGLLRADGRMVHDMYLVEVKKPDESHYPWDYYDGVAVTDDGLR
jgi:Periplasmic binding protein